MTVRHLLRALAGARALTLLKALVITALLLSAVFRDPSPTSQFFITSFVFLGALVISWQAALGRQYVWVCAFAAICIFFAPVLKVVRPSSDGFLLADLIAIVIFAISISAVSSSLLKKPA